MALPCCHSPCSEETGTETILQLGPVRSSNEPTLVQPRVHNSPRHTGHLGELFCNMDRQSAQDAHHGGAVLLAERSPKPPMRTGRPEMFKIIAFCLSPPGKGPSRLRMLSTCVHHGHWHVSPIDWAELAPDVCLPCSIPGLANVQTGFQRQPPSRSTNCAPPKSSLVTTCTSSRNANHTSPGSMPAFTSDRAPWSVRRAEASRSPPARLLHVDGRHAARRLRPSTCNKWEQRTKACNFDELVHHGASMDRTGPLDPARLPLELRVPHSPPQPWLGGRTGRVNKPLRPLQNRKSLRNQYAKTGTGGNPTDSSVTHLQSCHGRQHERPHRFTWHCRSGEIFHSRTKQIQQRCATRRVLRRFASLCGPRTSNGHAPAMAA